VSLRENNFCFGFIVVQTEPADTMCGYRRFGERFLHEYWQFGTNAATSTRISARGVNKIIVQTMTPGLPVDLSLLLETIRQFLHRIGTSHCSRREKVS
jgi:hypothetical protein